MLLKNLFSWLTRWQSDSDGIQSRKRTPVRKTVEEIVYGHEVRNAELRQVLASHGVKMDAPRTIECHFWTWSEQDNRQLAEALEARGFTILRRGPAAISENPPLWNLEAAVEQSVDLTIAREFVSDLARLADSYAGEYDGWGTKV